MASRDLTNTFFERRQAANVRRRSSTDSKLTAGVSDRIKPFGISKKPKGSASDDHLLLEEGLTAMSSISSDKNLPNTTLPPKWVDDVDETHTILAEITRLMGVLASLHSSRLGSVFGNDLEHQEVEIDQLTSDITKRFRHAEGLLKRIGYATSQQKDKEERTVGSNVQRSLAQKLQALSVEFRQKQRKYLKDVQIQKGGSGGAGLAAENEAKFGIDFNNKIDDNRVGFSPQQLAVVDDLQEAVQSRDEEISKIAQSIEELGSIFKELAVLVIDQGTILDRIDYNMEAVVEHTKEGIVQLQKAESHQKNARPMKCIVCLLTVIGILLVILVFKHRRRHF